jgi:hypothetical protein
MAQPGGIMWNFKFLTATLIGTLAFSEAKAIECWKRVGAEDETKTDPTSSNLDYRPEDYGLPAGTRGVYQGFELLDGTVAHSLTIELAPGRSQTRFKGVTKAEHIRRILETRAGVEKTLTFFGYSGAGYNQPQSMLKAAELEMQAISESTRPKTAIIIGATPEGIGQVYPVAKSLNFAATVGIVSSLGKDYLSLEGTRSVDIIFIVEDTTWGGFPSGVKEGTFEDLSPTSKAMVAASDRLIGLGGGEVTGAELQVAKKLQKDVLFLEMESSREIALKKWQKKLASLKPGETPPPEPTDFASPARKYLKDLLAYRP